MACRCGEKAGATTPGDAYGPIVVQENHYDPWGLGLPLNADGEKVGGSPEDRFKFIGRESQQSTGWVDLQARFYVPQIGRFLGVDPVTETQEHLSVYQYGWNNPVLRSDPNGEFPECCGGIGDFLTGVAKSVISDKISKPASDAVTSGTLSEQANNIYQAAVYGWGKMSDWVKDKYKEATAQKIKRVCTRL